MLIYMFLTKYRRDTYEIFSEPVDPNEVCLTDISLSNILNVFLFFLLMMMKFSALLLG